MKNIFLLFLLTLLACQPSIPENSETPETTPPVEDSPPSEVADGHGSSISIGPEYPVAEVKKVFTVKIEDTNYTVSQKAKIRGAEIIIEKVFNSEEFKVEVLSRTFTSTQLSSLEVYEKLFRGAEALIPAVNYQMDLKVTMYSSSFSKVIGYTTPKSLVVNTNLKFHQNYSVCEVAANLTHEWTHKMGFDHASAKDYNSVPYSLGSIIKKLCINAT